MSAGLRTASVPPDRATTPAEPPGSEAYLSGPGFSEAASTEDIRACFRLLLGRDPNPEEWRGHASRAGETLHSVVASYVGSLEFSRRGLLREDESARPTLTELREFRIYSAPDDAAVGRYVQADAYEPEVSANFRRILRPGMGVLDIGANIGYFTMLGAALVGPSGHVLAIEPNGRNVRLLEASRRANGFAHVTVAQLAAGAETGVLVLHRSHSNGTTSPPGAELAALLGAETVGCVRPDALVPAARRIDLIKVDVEGAEYLALSGCAEIIRRDRPVIISEFSPNLMPGISGVSGPDFLAWLTGRGYALSVITPRGGAEPAGIDRVMAIQAERGIDHVDILAEPAQEQRFAWRRG